MKYATCLVFLAACMIAGCGASKVKSVPPNEGQKVTVIDNDGQRKTIGVSELFDDQTGEPLVKKVFCVDRRRGKKVWVDPKAIRERDLSSSYLVPISE
jgi:hypothetical protein